MASIEILIITHEKTASAAKKHVMGLLNAMHTDEQDSPIAPEWSIDGAGVDEVLEWDCGGEDLVHEFIEISGTEWRNALNDLLLTVGEGPNAVMDAYNDKRAFARVSGRGRELGAYAGWPVKVFYEWPDEKDSWLDPIRYPTDLSPGRLKEILSDSNPAWVCKVGTHY
jgi:hypothetical protein